MTTILMRRRLAQRGYIADDSGFSVLEVLVSFVIFAVVAGSAMAAMVSAVKASHKSQQRVDAANIALSFISALQADTTQVTPDAGTTALPGGNLVNEAFTVFRKVTFPARATQCTSGVSFTVDVTVYQAQAYAKHPNTTKPLARNDSVITC